MTIKTTAFVSASELFDGHRELFDALCEANVDFAWGTNERSLVTSDDVYDALAYHVTDDLPGGLLSRLTKLEREGVLIDFES